MSTGSGRRRGPSRTALACSAQRAGRAPLCFRFFLCLCLPCFFSLRRFCSTVQRDSGHEQGQAGGTSPGMAGRRTEAARERHIITDSLAALSPLLPPAAPTFFSFSFFFFLSLRLRLPPSACSHTVRAVQAVQPKQQSGEGQQPGQHSARERRGRAGGSCPRRKHAHACTTRQWCRSQSAVAGGGGSPLWRPPPPRPPPAAAPSRSTSPSSPCCASWPPPGPWQTPPWSRRPPAGGDGSRRAGRRGRTAEGVGCCPCI